MWGYDFVDQHLLMLRDEARTNAFRAAIESVVKPGMTVLDFGTGSGILAFFAQRAGASRVYAVDRSPFLRAARATAKLNGFDRVSFIQTDGGEFELPEQVDVLVSECIGHYVLEERMIPHVLRARAKHLKPGGVVLPSRVEWRAALVTAPVDESGVEFFGNRPYGIGFQPLQELAASRRIKTPIPPSAVTTSAAMGALDLSHASDEPKTTSGRVSLDEDVVAYGLAGWFDATLAADIVLRTGPDKQPTHWMQSFFGFQAPCRIPRGDVDITIDPVVVGDLTFWRWSVRFNDTTVSNDELVRLHFTRGPKSAREG